MDIEVNGRKFEVKEIKYKDAVKLGQIPQEEAAMKLMLLSTGMSEEEYDDLSLKEGTEIQKAANQINGFGDFQNPSLTNK